MRSALTRALLRLQSAAAPGAVGSVIHGAAGRAKAAAGDGVAIACLTSLRAFGSSAAKTGCRGLLQHGGTSPAAPGAFTAAAARGGPARQAGSAAWQAVAAAAARQQARGYSRFLQFQPRSGGDGLGGWGGGSRWATLDPDKVLWGLIGANVAGFALWRLFPSQVGFSRSVSCLRCWLRQNLALHPLAACISMNPTSRAAC
jgi:hypothetical protein